MSETRKYSVVIKHVMYFDCVVEADSPQHAQELALESDSEWEQTDCETDVVGCY